MADPTTISGSTLIWSYSVDAGVTYKVVVCKKSANLEGSRNVSTSENDCGISKSFGPANYVLNYTGDLDTVPDATEGSHTELLTLFDANTPFMSKFATAGNEPYIVGTGKLSKLTVSASSPSDTVTFDATFEFYGTVDITP